ncbi:MAG: zinc ABC transporter substrate-binding protein [Deltaproteobacteria bacterium]|nr:zinc ABC transporter substrate-binding protein [Deltaproteobacteria bacterium]
MKLSSLTSFLAAAIAALLPARAHAKLAIVATVPDLGALAREIGGDRVSVTTLALPTQDPHFVDARPNLALALNKADLLMSIGLGLEVGWLPTLQTAARNPKIQNGSAGFLECSQFVKLLDVPAVAVDRSQGDIHPTGNPHYLYDPRAAVLVARGIARRLGELDPKNAQIYDTNAKGFSDRLEAARRGWEKQLAPLRGAGIITFHKSWVYLSDWLGLDEVGYIEPKPGIPPNPSHVARLLGLGKQRKVRLILQEAYYPDSTSKFLGGKLGAATLKLAGGTDFRANQSYLGRMQALVKQLAATLATP